MRHHKHFFSPAWQIAFFEGVMFLFEMHAIAHMAFGRWVLGVQALPLKSVPHVGHSAGGDLMRGHADTPMIGVIVRLNQRL